LKAGEPIDLYADPGDDELQEVASKQDEDLILKEEIFFGRPLAVWLGLLNSDDYLARMTAISNLVKIGPKGKAALPILTGLLRQEHDYIFKRKVIEALGAMGQEGKAAIPDLEQSQYQEGLREASALALGKIRNDTPDLKARCLQILEFLRQGDLASLKAQAFAPFAEVITESWLQNLRTQLPTAEARVVIQGTVSFSFVRILFGKEDDPFPDHSLYLEFREVKDEQAPSPSPQQLSALYRKGT
jgi:hypothetical protein